MPKHYFFIMGDLSEPMSIYLSGTEDNFGMMEDSFLNRLSLMINGTL